MTQLIDRLPKVRGRYKERASLARVTWFRVGGPAEVLFKPADLEDLCFFLKEKPKDIPVYVVGVGSNLLIRDGGIPGVVIRLGRGFTNMMIEDDIFEVGAGMLDRTVAFASRDEGIAGLEFLCGIPGTIGGALRMNAGAYGGDIQSILVSAMAVDPQGRVHHLTNAECGFSYRHSAVPKDWIFVGARLKGHRGDSAEIGQKIEKMLAERDDSQPVRTRTGGSTFANPEGGKAWELIDQAGYRGATLGGAQVSEKHCNFLINRGDAMAKDLETLGEQVRQKVAEMSGIDLRWEIQRIGTPLEKNAGVKEKVA